ncbi:stage III sporulation protein AF [Bacillus sp. Bva_UNVM-123]|uniref:stage III sporulation protein AF n=1 Tax=Bacillus sp. Bva_UNVM-123 TaxID=2829798 RepID=UPI00391F9908
MEFIKEWITNIIIFVLLATVIDMLLPNSSFQKYTKMVTGLLLIVVILTPILKLVSSDFEKKIAAIPFFEASDEKKLENSIELKKKEIQAWQHAYILEDMQVQLKMKVEEELMDQYGLEIMDIDFQEDENSPRAFPENLQKVFIQLKHKDEEAEAVEVVQKVNINTRETLPLNRPDNMTKKVASLLAHEWNMNEEIIEVLVEGRKMKKNE